MPIRVKRRALLPSIIILAIVIVALSNIALVVKHTKTSQLERTLQPPEQYQAPPPNTSRSNQSSLPYPARSENRTCLSPSCFPMVASRLARAFPDKKNHSAWIINTKKSAMDESQPCAGIIYVKNFKAASSTAAGAALRIAVEHGAGAPPKNSPKPRHPAWVRFSHVRGHHYSKCDQDRTILFTSLRDPAARALSRIFYTSITLHGESTSDKNLIEKLHWNHPQFGAVSHSGGGYQVRYVSLHKDLETSWTSESPTTVLNPQQVERYVKEIVDQYDFLLVAERMDESLVAMALALDLDVRDVLVMNAKQNVGQEYLYFSQRTRKHGLRESCKLSVSAFRSQAVHAHLESAEWYAKNYGDYLLHSAANQSLDLTMERLGRDRFDTAMAEYKRLKAMANKICANQTVSHCSPEGKPQRELSSRNCYSDDSGCGFPCIDKMLAAEKRASVSS